MCGAMIAHPATAVPATSFAQHERCDVCCRHRPHLWGHPLALPGRVAAPRLRQERRRLVPLARSAAAATIPASILDAVLHVLDEHGDTTPIQRVQRVKGGYESTS